MTEDGDELRQAILPILRWAISKKGTVIAHCSRSMIEKGKNRQNRLDLQEWPAMFKNNSGFIIVLLIIGLTTTVI